MADLFKKLDHATVEQHPFPYVVLEDFLPDGICEDLLRKMPSISVLSHGHSLGDNQRFNFSYADAVSTPSISKNWLDVLAQGVSQNFLDRLLRIFGPSIREFYPDFESRFGDLYKLKTKIRQKGASRARDSIMMDAQIAINTPARTGGTSVRTPHLDRTDKLFIGLLYLRLPDDDSKGADLELLSAKQGEHLVYGHQRMLEAAQTIHVRTIPYRCNTLVLMLNTPKSIHGVSPRQATPHTRYFINLVGETCEPLFAVETLPAPEQSKPRRYGFIRRGLNRALASSLARIKDAAHGRAGKSPAR
jgi:hypothetical protein